MLEFAAVQRQLCLCQQPVGFHSNAALVVQAYRSVAHPSPVWLTSTGSCRVAEGSSKGREQ